MIKRIQLYLNQIYQEIDEKLSSEFDIKHIRFDDFCVFDCVNFYLIHQYILDENKEDFFISIPEDDYRPNFFTSIFHSLVLIKLFQNYFSYEKIQPELSKGDLIYTKFQNKKRVCEIKNIFCDSSIKINLKFPEKNEHIYDFSLNGKHYTKINPNLSNGRNTAKNINDYSNFLTENFGEEFPFITNFKNRSIVIADKSFFKESKHLPIRYTNKKGKIKNDLPFFNYLIECCNNFETAEKYLLNSNQTFDEIIIIGDSKYRECFDLILQKAKFQGKVKNIILIGTDKPDTPNEFTEWLWSNDETKLANKEIPNHPTKVTLTNEKLYNKLIELKDGIESIKNDKGVNLSFILKYTNFYFRLIVSNSELSKGIYQEYTDRLENYFKSEAFENELNNLFYDKNIFCGETIKNCTGILFKIFNDISQILAYENLKWKYIKTVSQKEKKLYLLVEKKNYDIIQNQIRRERLWNINLISDKRIDNNKEYLDKWLNGTNNSEKSTIIIPYLNNILMFNKLISIKGKCEVLCYENIDEIPFDKIDHSYSNDELKRLSHSDRKSFFKTSFEYINSIKKKELDDIFNFNLNKDDIRSYSYESIDLPKEKNTYELAFTDGSTDKLDSTKGIFLIDNKDFIKTSIGEIFEGATIRFYQNTTPKEFNKILKIFDTEKLLKSFDEYALSWRETLRKLSIDFNGIDNLYAEIFDDNYRINFNTFKQYFEDSSQTRFPRIKTLEAIKGLCLRIGRNNELVVIEFDKFKSYSKKDHSIRQQAGRILGNDLLDYVASDKTEISDSLRNISEDILDKITETIQEKTVTKKVLLEND